MDLAVAEQSFMVVVAVATFVALWALWMALAGQPPIEERLKALRTRRMKTRSEQAGRGRPSPKATSLGFMRSIADRLNLLRGAAADRTTRKLRQAGFFSRDAAIVYVFIKLALPLALGFLMILLTSTSDLIEVPEDLVLPTCVGAVLAGFMMPELYIKNVAAKRHGDPEPRAAGGARPADDLRRGRPQHRRRLPAGGQGNAGFDARTRHGVRDDRHRAHLPAGPAAGAGEHGRTLGILRNGRPGECSPSD